MFILTDTFNRLIISRHRSLDAAVKARAKHGRAVRKSNGASSYIPTQITEMRAGKKSQIDIDEIYAAEDRAGF